MKERWYFVSALVLLAFGLIALNAGRTPSSAALAQAYPQTAPAGNPMNSIENPYTKDNFGPWNAHVAEVHVPMVSYEKTAMGLKVTIQVDNHPMDAKTPHYIMWIQLMDGMGTKLGEKKFKATDAGPAKATFELASTPETLKAYEQCNIHGVWLNEVKVENK